MLTAAERGGFACEAVVNRGFAARPGDWPERFRVEAVLDVPGHSKYTAFGELDRLAPDGSPRLRPALPWAAGHAVRRRRERIAAFAHALAPVVRRATAGDIVLLATASELDVAGLAAAIDAGRAAAGVGWHALFHYPLYRGLLPDFPRQERRLDRLRQLLAEALARTAPARIHIHVTTAELQAHYTRLGVAPIHVLPYPVRAAARDGRAVSDRPLRIVTLGDARPEKGSHHLASLVERTNVDAALAGKVTFAIQANCGCPPNSWKAADRAVRTALGRLATLAQGPSPPAAAVSSVELLPGPIMGTAYEAALAAADATILPYDQRRYHARCSGVLLESLSSGVVPIVTGGGSMGRLLADPIRAHVASLLGQAAILSQERHGPLRAGRAQPWETQFHRPSGATAVVVALQWRVAGHEALLAVPARVELAGSGPNRSAALVAADPQGRESSALLPLPRLPAAGPLRLRVSPVDHPTPLELAQVTVTTIDAGPQPPVGAVGIVIPPSDDLVAGLVAALHELVRHADHYRSSAARLAPMVAERHRGDRVVAALAAFSDGRTVRAP